MLLSRSFEALRGLRLNIQNLRPQGNTLQSEFQAGRP